MADLTTAGLLNRSDAALIELAAVQLGRAREAREVLNAEGLTVTSTRGTTIRHPAGVIEQQASLEARRCLEVLGIGPSSRARFGMPDAASPNPFWSKLDPPLREQIRGRSASTGDCD